MWREPSGFLSLLYILTALGNAPNRYPETAIESKG